MSSEDGDAARNGTICGGDPDVGVVNSTAGAVSADPAGGIACAETSFFLAIYGPLYDVLARPRHSLDANPVDRNHTSRDG